MALEELIRYQKDGDSVLGTDRQRTSSACRRTIRVFTERVYSGDGLSSGSGELSDWLSQNAVPNAEDFFYWERVKFGLKPTLHMNHMVIYRGSKLPDAVEAVAIKQLYVSHYFHPALDLSVCVKASGQPEQKGFYLITIKGSRQAGLTGLKGSITRSAAVSKTRSALEASLTHVKRVLESSQ